MYSQMIQNLYCNREDPEATQRILKTSSIQTSVFCFSIAFPGLGQTKLSFVGIICIHANVANHVNVHLLLYCILYIFCLGSIRIDVHWTHLGTWCYDLEITWNTSDA